MFARPMPASTSATAADTAITTKLKAAYRFTAFGALFVGALHGPLGCGAGTPSSSVRGAPCSSPSDAGAAFSLSRAVEIASGGEIIIVTVTSGGISPSPMQVVEGSQIIFVNAGDKDSPTSVTVTSDDRDVPDTALFGGKGNTYAVPSTQEVQDVEIPEGVSGRVKSSFTIEASGHTAKIIIPHEGLDGTPMQQSTPPTRSTPTTTTPTE